MAATTNNKSTPKRLGDTISIPVKASTKIPRGAQVNVDSNGYALNAGDNANDTHFGTAVAEADNSSGSAGDINVTVHRDIVLMNSAETESQASLGALRYISDNQTVAAVGTTTNDVLMGVVVDVESTSQVWVEPLFKTA